ncbi:hypothetical protein GCM10025783_10800 [Amnibacterium soli]|uniref:Uncharacterized protein n=1 Tax=Amnibacterium soli TaxID=1282736 RepID=A0ABP8YYC9_9MICO
MTDEGEALRRRLYRPGAAADDVAAYLAAAPAAPVAPVAAPPGRRPVPGRLVAAAVVVAALAVGRSGPATAERPAPTASAQAVAGPAPLPTAPVDAAARAAFVRKVAVGGDAGLALWWGGPQALVEVHGAGATTIALPAARTDRAGHLTVLLVLGTDGTARWTAARFVIHDDRTIHLAPVAGAEGALRAGVPTVARVDYPAGRRPQRLVLQVPEGTQWGAAAVDSVDSGPQLPDG